MLSVCTLFDDKNEPISAQILDSYLKIHIASKRQLHTFHFVEVL